ncbi:hypothetical protein M513_02663 [Trichuris suis]|uniref:CUB domain-containing protein n=1 Tax=Trichuris suis TaxID=68888 RepID=A0A085MH63_9BILA|nr:hypothetical protein M513_02663 [Trichuris suis]
MLSTVIKVGLTATCYAHLHLLYSNNNKLFPLAVHCDVDLNSEHNRSGSITSPNYPNQYPTNIRCAYRFRSKGSERVQLTFTDFDLHVQPDQDDTSHL